MSHLLDVNVLLACAWQSHANHAKANVWLDRQKHFVTCPISQLGFLRVSMSPGYRASFHDAQSVLAEIVSRKSAAFIEDSAAADALPVVTAHGDVTDAYLVILAKRHNLRLATLDITLCAKPWARGIAEKPF